ncbi:hypothetical protein CWC46_16020 [Prodigiosinella confusarubida]|uniref:Uncharacterized protein n=1 Tax=Serratia sp. (strain ATCC 39006) TaxID=104623 RepID=A0A800XMD9_SERS3|nr:hypothetical protein CWC46_16020 [Serratia sp. ATCC 39006]
MNYVNFPDNDSQLFIRPESILWPFTQRIRAALCRRLAPSIPLVVAQNDLHTIIFKGVPGGGKA